MSEMGTRERTVRIEWGKALLVAVLLAAIALLIGRNFIFGPAVLEGGDFAANALSINRAKNFLEIYGNYSRWGFNHPGPFFFYVYAVGEIFLFDILHVVQSPHQAHVVFGVMLQSAFMAGAIAVSLFLVRDRRILLAWALVGCVFFGIFYIALSSIWPPHVLFGPYLLLLVASAALSLGWFRFFPACVFCVCVLCHGHIAQPLLTFPVLGASVLGFIWKIKNGAIADVAWISKSSRVWNVLLCLLIVGVFSAPILLDLLRCPDCNLGRVLAYMKTKHGDLPRFGQAINYIGSYFFFDRTPEWLGSIRNVSIFSGRVLFAAVVILAAILLPKFMGRRGEASRGDGTLKRVVIFCLLGFVLSLIWALRITGPLYEFNSFFVYAICALLAVSIVYFLIAKIPTKILAPLCLIVAAFAFFFVPKYMANFQVFSQHSTIPGGAEPVKFDRPDVQAAINQIDGQDWLLNMGLAVRLARSGVQYWAPRDWTYVFGWKNAYPDDLFLGQAVNVRIFDKKGGQPAVHFDDSEFCRVSEASPVLDTQGGIENFNALRRNCSIVAARFGRAGSDDEWEWIPDRVAALQFRTRASNVPVELSLDVMPYLGNGKIFDQDLDVYVNGEKVESRKVAREGVERLMISNTVWNHSPITTVTLVLNGKSSPKELGLSADDRRLSIGLRGVGVRYPVN